MRDRQAPRRLYSVVGLSRSGNHAIMDWILRQLQGRWCFLNCVEAKSNPWATARPMDDGSRFRSNVAGNGEAAFDHVVLSQEDAFLGPALGGATEAAHDEAFGRPRERLRILILRDPYNLVASRGHIASARISESNAIRIWRQHAAAFLAGRFGGRTIVPVSYNLWVANRAYRRQIADALALEFSDDGARHVPACAGGSSFDGRALDGAAGSMAVFDRWRSRVDDPAYWKLFNEQARDLAWRAFGFSPPAIGGDEQPPAESPAGSAAPVDAEVRRDLLARGASNHPPVVGT